MSTPFGSLAYNKSSGGSEILLGMKAASLTFISPITYKTPLVFPIEEFKKIKIEVVGGEADLIIDGIYKEKFVKKVFVEWKRKFVKYYIGANTSL